MSSAESSSIVGMDMSASPCTSTQCPETTPSPCMKMCSKIISTCQRSERMPSIVTPENIHQSPFVKPKVLFNPFNRNLRERLENPIFSPDVFSTAMSPSQVQTYIYFHVSTEERTHKYEPRCEL